MPQLAPYATNVHGVQRAPLDYSAADQFNTMSYHGLSIAVNDNIIGRINSWNPQLGSLAAEHLYELNGKTAGLPVDLVPGNLSGMSISFTRNEVWGQETEQTFGEPLWDDLGHQTKPHKVEEHLMKGQDPYRVWDYLGCLFTEKSPEGFTAQGNFVVSTSATLMYVTRRRRL